MLVQRAKITGAGTLPPLFPITPTDHGGYVLVVVYILLVLMLLLVITRLFTRWYMVRDVKGDDVFLVVAASLAVLHCVFVQLAVNHGLGKSMSIVSNVDFDYFQKYSYAADIVLVGALGASKISLALLIQSLMAEGRSLMASRGLLAVVVAWTVSSMFAEAFGCDFPTPWRWTHPGQCVNLSALHNAVSAVNIATDALLVVLPCIVFSKVHDKIRRYRVVALFTSRILVCVVSGLQLRAFNRSLSSSDTTWVNMKVVVWNEFMMSFSIICTAIPSLGRLIVELQPEVNAFAITQQHGLRNNDKYALSSFGHRFPASYVSNNRLGVHTSVSRSRSRTHDAESMEGLAEDGMKQNQNVIKQTVGFEVKYLNEHVD